MERGAGVPDKPARQPRKKDPKLDLDLLEVRWPRRGMTTSSVSHID